jgi:hypothetical protein
MALATIGEFLWPPMMTAAPVNLRLTTVIDAADEIAACVFLAPKTGTVTRVHFSTATVTTGATVDVRLETVDDANGQPSGTLFGTDTNISHVIANGDDNAWLRTAALTGSASVTRGQMMALVIKNPTVSAGNMQIARLGGTFGANGSNFPYVVGPLATNKQDSQYGLVMALEYNDGSFGIPAGLIPAKATGTVALNTGTNPDEAAMYFTPTAPMRVIGWASIMAVAAGADFRVGLYEDGNNTPLTTGTIDGNNVATTATRGHTGHFATAVELDAGTTYRLAFLPTTANSLTLNYWEIDSSYLAIFDALAGGQAMHYSARNRSSTTDPDAAAWSQTTNRRLAVSLICDQIDDGAGGGGGAVLPPGSLVGGIHQ